MNRETRMTITDFLIALEEATPDDWYLDADYQIRRYDETRQRVCCPITALGVEHFANLFHEDAKRLGLTRAHAELIARTADGLEPYASWEMRQRLLQATVNRQPREEDETQGWSPEEAAS